MAAKNTPLTRHIVSINDLTNREIEAIFETAESFLEAQGDPKLRYRIGRSASTATNFILASLFYEPSTRTRLSFESAMLRLGGQTITSADPATSSAAKGESLADSIRVIANYADILVIRHPRDGAARLAAEFSPIPVINGGDGSHEHPTQTLCDLFTLRKRNKQLKNMKVAISGDLKGSRTIHSFVYALARFGAIIDPMPAPGMALPHHVDRRLREEFRMVSKRKDESGSFDALYVTPDEPHQQSLFSGPEIDLNVLVQKKIDAVYVTRFQKERWVEKEQPYPKIDAKFLKDAKYTDASVMHPLPRVGELDVSLDSDRRAVYFQQASYGVPVRMALIALLLNVEKSKSLQKFPAGFAKPERPIYQKAIGTGVHCGNANCIVREPSEQQYATNKFYVIPNPATKQCRLRCLYCESDIEEHETEQFAVGDIAKGVFTKGLGQLSKVSQERLDHIVIYKSAAEASEAGFTFKPLEPKARAS